MKNCRSFQILLLLGYILGVHKGYVALWQGTDPNPIRVFPIRAQMLPAEDQKRLESGINIQEDTKLFDLLEDYLS